MLLYIPVRQNSKILIEQYFNLLNGYQLDHILIIVQKDIKQLINFI